MKIKPFFSLLLAVLFLGLAIGVPSAHGANTPAFIQQKAGASAATQNTGCAYTTNPVFGDFLTVDFSWYPTTITVSSVTDTLGNTFTDAGVVTQSSSTQTFKSDVWYAPQSKATGADTITVALSAAPTFIFLTCLEFSNVEPVTRVAEQTNTGTYTSGTSFTASVASYTPTSGDLSIAYVGYISCSATGTITYATGFTAGTGKGTDAATSSTCITAGSKKFQFNEADQYFPNTGTTATTASFVVADSAPTTNTGGWAEIVLQFKPTVSTSEPLTGSIGLTASLSRAINRKLAGSIGISSSLSIGHFYSLTGSIGIVESLTKQIGHLIGLSGSVGLIENLAEQFSYTRALLATLGITSSLTNIASHFVGLMAHFTINTVVSRTASLSKSLSGAITISSTSSNQFTSGGGGGSSSSTCDTTCVFSTWLPIIAVLIVLTLILATFSFLFIRRNYDIVIFPD